jgi:hypothetical protein
VNKTTQLKILFWVYLAIVGGYLIYGYITKTGLYALLIDEQLKRFGQADTRIALFVPLIALLLPMAPVAKYIRTKEVEARMDAAGIQGSSRHRTNYPPPTQEKRSQWVWVGIFAALPLLISVGAYFYLTAVDSADQSRQVYHLDLASSADLPVGDVKFIEIAGVLQQDSGYRLTETLSGMKSGHSYTPVTGPMWNPSEPVKYLLYLKSDGADRIAIGHFDKQTGRYDVMPARGPYNSVFGGELSKNSLPDYVKSALDRRGIKTTDPYYVLEWKGDMDRPPGSQYNSQMYYLIPFFGAFFSMVILAGGGIAYVNRRRQRARVAR